MNSIQQYPKQVFLALSLTVFASACSPSTKPGGTPPRPVLPDIPATLSVECYEPGVAPEALAALTQTRLALAACRRKHNDTVAFYLDVKGRMQ